MIQPHEIMIGSCFNQVIDEFEPCAPKPIFWNETNWYRIGECIEFYEWFEPIPITEKILVEWCGEMFEPEEDEGDIIYYKLIGTRFLIVFNHDDISLNYETSDGYYCLKYWDLGIPLHHLQMLILALTNQPLKITLK